MNTQTQLPPISSDSEQAMLGSLLIDRDAISVVAGWFSPDAFYDGRNRTVYAAMLDLWRDRVPCDIVSLNDALKAHDPGGSVGGFAYLAELQQSTPTAVHVQHYAKTVQVKARQRALIDFGSDVVRTAHAGTPNPDDLAGAMRRAFDRFPDPDDAALTDPGDEWDASLEQTEAVWDGTLDDPVIKTGIRALDGMLLGGIRPGELIYLGGRPGMGKSQLMLDIAKSAALATCKTSVIIELEMTKEVTRKRMIAVEAGVPFAVGYAKDATMRHKDAWRRATQWLSPLPIRIETKLHTTDRIRGFCERIAATTPVGAVFIDHLSLLRDRTGASSAEQETSAISKRCRALAVDLNVPVIVLSQLNREVEGAPPFVPTLKSLKYSGSLEADADHVWMLYRRKYYVDRSMLKPDPDMDWIAPMSSIQRAELFVEKNRSGAAGSVILGWEPEVMRFSDPRAIAA